MQELSHRNLLLEADRTWQLLGFNTGNLSLHCGVRLNRFSCLGARFGFALAATMGAFNDLPGRKKKQFDFRKFKTNGRAPTQV